MRLLTLCCAAAALAVSPAFAQSGPGPDKDKGKSVEELHKEDLAKAAASAWTGAPVEERTVASKHSVNVDGRTLKYTATAGTLTIRNAEGKPEASIFYTADTLDGAPSGSRPIMFF
jgi:carboxypeptidase C (cathepsin A)